LKNKNRSRRVEFRNKNCCKKRKLVEIIEEIKKT